MSFSFDPGLSNPISIVRQRIGDTVDVEPTLHMVEDETITAYLVSLTPLKTAARLCRDLAAQCARLVDSEGDRQSSKASQLYTHYIALASILDAEAQSELSAITTPGAISVSGTCRGRDDNPIPGISSRPWDFGYGFGMPSDYPWEY